jgi:hypothetical protein
MREPTHLEAGGDFIIALSKGLHKDPKQLFRIGGALGWAAALSVVALNTRRIRIQLSQQAQKLGGWD